MRHYDRLARIYDAQYADEQESKIEAALGDVRLELNSSVLDLGCGTGLLFRYIGNSVKLLVGIDISPRILTEAKEQARKFKNVALLRAEADHLPFKSQIFDIVFVITIIQNTPNPATTLGETRRISKQDAVVVVTALKKEFTLKILKQLLKKTRLGIKTMKTDNNLKDYIATCKCLT